MIERFNDKFKSIMKYPNMVGMAAFTAVTIVQTALFIAWLTKNLVVINSISGKYQFQYKGLGSMILMGVSLFWLLNVLVKKVVGKEMKTNPAIIISTAYVLTIPTIVSINFNTPIYGVCLSLLMLNTIFQCQYFYERHDLRLYRLIAMFAILCELGYLNRTAFWAGLAETFVFLSIQLYRNLKTKRKNIADKSWRNTLLLFCILIIIVLMPQYFNYNNVQAARYNYSVKQQLAARVITPYLELERIEKNEEYLLGVVRAEDYGLGHNYRNFNEIMHRYEMDNLDMDEIWSNLYNNARYRYSKNIVTRYVKNSAKGFFAPFCVLGEMNSKDTITHHGYYYGLFQNNSPVLSNIYMRFGLISLSFISAALLIQLVIKIVLDLLLGKFKARLEAGEHKIIEEILLALCVSVVYLLLQTLFSLEGTSYVTSASATLAWFATSAFLWYEKK